ncbi:tetratricopeptide repeat protein [Paracraurococcus lichenis]|uniref:Tetratricopeptide repeat protein n=1 Tax=Paracraurococcus lichenis TaxID=3064888 RepID=A0ABT9E6H9_9PROT|nr:hypothetical protein [Paracraurococcus sp. LOR1-02]MDO9711751.1 hypothetical protein [Paracraurococcus sp. LOR1-02]
MRPLAPPGGTALPSPSVWIRLTTGLLCGLAICAEMVITAAALRALAPPDLLLTAQLATSIACLLGAAALYRCGGRDPAGLLLLLASAVTGPFGALGGGLCAALRIGFASSATPFEQWYAALFPAVEVSPVEALYERVVLRGSGPEARGGVAPFSDIMALGTVPQKQAAIALIADEFRPSFAPALLRALNDPEPAIRVQAATASARIENRFLERALALEEQLAAAPRDPARLLALARHHDAYAHTGLLDGGRATAERHRALELYERLAWMRPADPELAQVIGRLLLRLDRPTEALDRLAPLVNRPGAPPELLAWYLECLYRLGRIGALRQAAARHGQSIAVSALPQEVRDICRLWAESAVEATPA